MKTFKKAVAVLLAAVLAVSMLAGCGGKSYGTPEEEILKKINESRTSTKSGLQPLSNDAELAAAAGKLLEAFANSGDAVPTTYGNGYKLDGQQIINALKDVNPTNKSIYINDYNYYGSGTSTLVVAPLVVNGQTYATSITYGTNYCLTRRVTVEDLGGNGYSGSYGYEIAKYNKVKVGIATRTINGDLFAMVVYDMEYVNN